MGTHEAEPPLVVGAGDAPEGAAPAPASAGPDEQLNCPLCEYDLRGLPEHRCPECGHQFDPEQLRQARLEHRQWHFEHVERHLVRGFAATTLVSLVPPLFWRRLAAAHEIRRSRLVLWARAWGAGIVLLPLASWMIAGLIADFTAPTGANPFHAVSDAIVEVADSRHLPTLLPVLAAVLAWPVLTVIVLQLFGHTLQRAGIRSSHLWRCALYALPLMALPTLLFAIASCHVALNSKHWRSWEYELMLRVPRAVGDIVAIINLSPMSFFVLAWLSIASTIHLVAAHLWYLRLRHAFPQALLVQAVTWLIIASGIVYLYGLI